MCNSEYAIERCVKDVIKGVQGISIIHLLIFDDIDNIALLYFVLLHCYQESVSNHWVVFFNEFTKLDSIYSSTSTESYLSMSTVYWELLSKSDSIFFCLFCLARWGNRHRAHSGWRLCSWRWKGKLSTFLYLKILKVNLKLLS